MVHSITELSLSFDFVSIPVRLYSTTETKDQISFYLLHKGCGSRVKQQHMCVKEGVIVERSDMVKGYQSANDQYVKFTPEELKAREEPVTQTVDIVACIPNGSIDPIYFDNAYYLAPNKRGDRPYRLLLEGTKRSVDARWPAGHGVVSRTRCKFGHQSKAASCCSSCCTRTKCAR